MSFSIATKNSLLLIVEKIIVLGFAFVNSVLLARLAGPELFGQFSYIISYGSLFAPLCIMGLNNIVTKYFINYPDSRHHYLVSALGVRAAGAIFSVFLALFIAYFMMKMPPELLIKVSILLVLQCFLALNVIEYYFLAKNNVSSPLKIRLPILSVMAMVKFGAIYFSADLITLIFLYGLEYALIGLGYLWIYLKNKKNSLQPEEQRLAFTLFHQGKWLFFSGLAAIIYLKIDQIMLAQYYDHKEVAYYAAAAKLSEFWYVFPVLIANALTTNLINLHKKSEKKYNAYLLTLLSLMVFGAIIISALTYLFSDRIIDTIYGEQFSQSAAILNIHIFASIFVFQRAIFSKWLIIAGAYKYSLVTHGIGALINIVLNILLIPPLGGVGAAWATLISYMVASFIALFFKHSTRKFAYLMCNAMALWPIHLYRSLLRGKNNKDQNVTP